MEYQFDFSKISVKEYRSLFDPKQKDKDSDAIQARVAGLEPADIEKMPWDEYRRFGKAFFAAAREAGTEKNSPSESTAP